MEKKMLTSNDVKIGDIVVGNNGDLKAISIVAEDRVYVHPTLAYTYTYDFFRLATPLEAYCYKNLDFTKVDQVYEKGVPYKIYEKNKELLKTNIFRYNDHFYYPIYILDENEKLKYFNKNNSLSDSYNSLSCLEDCKFIENKELDKISKDILISINGYFEKIAFNSNYKIENLAEKEEQFRFKSTRKYAFKGFNVDDKGLYCKGRTYFEESYNRVFYKNENNIDSSTFLDTPFDKNPLKKDPFTFCSDSGYHYCNNLRDINSYYPLKDKNKRFFVIEVLGDFKDDEKDANIFFSNGPKSITNAFRLVREVTEDEITEALSSTSFPSVVALKSYDFSIIKEFQENYPELILTGGAALYLHGFRFSKDNDNPSDIDFISPRFINFVEDKLVKNVTEYDSEEFSGKEFKMSCAIKDGVKVEAAVIPSEEYTYITHKDGNRYKVAKLHNILYAKARYASEQNIQKHIDDFNKMTRV